MSSNSADGLTQRKGKKGGNNSSAPLLDKEDKPKPFKQSSSYLNLDPVSEKNLVRRWWCWVVVGGGGGGGGAGEGGRVGYCVRGGREVEGGGREGVGGW